MEKEVSNIENYGTWQLVSDLGNARILDVRWVFRRKADGRYRARLVA